MVIDPPKSVGPDTSLLKQRTASASPPASTNPCNSAASPLLDRSDSPKSVTVARARELSPAQSSPINAIYFNDFMVVFGLMLGPSYLLGKQDPCQDISFS